MPRGLLLQTKQYNNWRAFESFLPADSYLGLAQRICIMYSLLRVCVCARVALLINAAWPYAALFHYLLYHYTIRGYKQFYIIYICRYSPVVCRPNRCVKDAYWKCNVFIGMTMVSREILGWGANFEVTPNCVVAKKWYRFRRTCITSNSNLTRALPSIPIK